MKNTARMLRCAAGFAALLAAPAFADQAPTTSQTTAPPALPTLSQLDQDTTMTAAFDAMTVNHEAPDWLKSHAVTSPTQEVGFDGRHWLAMSSCKEHDCAAQRMAVIYDPKANVMYGVVSQTAKDGMDETLTWLNIGGGPESIDGRTILYAALTGSLQNHPDNFDYPTD